MVLHSVGVTVVGNSVVAIVVSCSTDAIVVLHSVRVTVVGHSVGAIVVTCSTDAIVVHVQLVLQ